MEQASAASKACCCRFPDGGMSTVVYSVSSCPRTLVVSTVTAIRKAVGRGWDVVRTASVSSSGMRPVSGAVVGQGCHLAG